MLCSGRHSRYAKVYCPRKEATVAQNTPDFGGSVVTARRQKRIVGVFDVPTLDRGNCRANGENFPRRGRASVLSVRPLRLGCKARLKVGKMLQKVDGGAVGDLR